LRCDFDFLIFISEIQKKKTKLIADYKELETTMTDMANFVKLETNTFFAKTVARAVEDGKYPKEGK
jgi:hypothetical protein